MASDETPKATPKETEKSEGTLAGLRAAAKGLLYPSEADKPLKAFLWNTPAVTAAENAQDALVAATEVDPATLKSVPLADFFETMTTPQDWHGPDEKAAVVQAQALVEWIRGHLTDILAFRVGDGPEIPAYVVGRDKDGNWVGLQTEIIET